MKIVTINIEISLEEHRELHEKDSSLCFIPFNLSDFD